MLCTNIISRVKEEEKNLDIVQRGGDNIKLNYFNEIKYGHILKGEGEWGWRSCLRFVSEALEQILYYEIIYMLQNYSTTNQTTTINLLDVLIDQDYVRNLFYTFSVQMFKLCWRGQGAGK